MPFPRLLAAALLGACSLGSHAATSYQLSYVAVADYQWSANDLNRHGTVSGEARTEDFTSRAFVHENGQTRLLKAIGNYNRGKAINDRGDVAGECQKHERNRSCIWKSGGGTEVIVNQLGGTRLFANVTDMNNARQVVGSAEGADRRTRPFLYEKGVMRDLGSLGGYWTGATAINKLGHVSGYGTLPDGTFHAFIHDGTQMKDLGALAEHAFAEALNDNDVAVGRADVSGGARHAVMFKDGQIIDLGTLGGDSEAQDINNNEVVVGMSREPYAAFVYRNGRMFDLNTQLDPVTGADWRLLSARKINDRGQILVIAQRPSDTDEHLVLLTPME